MNASADSQSPGPPNVILGVGAGIAAYKACELLRLFTESGHRVRVIPTDDALRFVGAPTWEALSGQPVATGVWSDVPDVPHVRIGKNADLVVVAPATADLLARAAHGLASDLLTNTLLTARCPLVFAPAMHTEMWLHPATQASVATLRERGAVVIEPASGRLTGADTGPGRLPDPGEIFFAARRVLRRGASGAGPDLAGRHLVVSSGGTREFLDPVRFLGNRSSGRQGHAFARTAVARGARVTLVTSADLPDPAGAEVVRVTSARDMHDAMRTAASTADALVMAAAVADFRPAAYQDHKIKKSGAEPDPIGLTLNPDILAELSAHRPRPGQVVVGFAAETHDVAENAAVKLKKKGCDLLVVNQVGDGMGFETADNAAVVISPDADPVPIPYGPKEDLADAVWDLVAARLLRA
ncbi:MAG TPA: bifunctional phosphopantothenoylcysteine decarboxylase/phosphopantothenate--cysteine ligase CoaBC [Streptosporangiaceae bacterium]|jgi:phosphopantothenoylcysteine decarboxylase/phosphopantothenate--cysteine ligase